MLYSTFQTSAYCPSQDRRSAAGHLPASLVTIKTIPTYRTGIPPRGRRRPLHLEGGQHARGWPDILQKQVRVCFYVISGLSTARMPSGPETLRRRRRPCQGSHGAGEGELPQHTGRGPLIFQTQAGPFVCSVPGLRARQLTVTVPLPDSFGSPR